jgi:hypothetical protein
MKFFTNPSDKLGFYETINVENSIVVLPLYKTS